MALHAGMLTSAIIPTQERHKSKTPRKLINPNRDAFSGIIVQVLRNRGAVQLVRVRLLNTYNTDFTTETLSTLSNNEEIKSNKFLQSSLSKYHQLIGHLTLNCFQQ